MKLPFSVNAYRDIEKAVTLTVALAKAELTDMIEAAESPSVINGLIDTATAIDTVVEYFKNINDEH